MYNQSLTVEEICRKLKPILGDKADKIYLSYRLANDRDKRQEIEQMIQALYLKHLNNSLLNQDVLLEPPARENIKGNYSLGMVNYANKDLYPFGLREKDFPRHICITGMSGSGKTNLGFQILRTFLTKGKPFIVFDWKKSFRPLTTISKNILVFTVGNENTRNLFKININRPPVGVGNKEWIGILSDIVNEAFFASHGVHKIISETLDEAFKNFGVYEGSGNYPTWFQIKEMLEEKTAVYKHGRESEWLTSAIRIAHELTFGSFGETVNSKDSFTIKVQDLLSKNVIFELHSLSSSQKKFFCEFLLTYIYKYKKSSNEHLTSEFKNAIVVDEAHNIFLKDKQVFMKESITESIYREIREYGVSLICMDQHVSKLSEVVAGNSACNIAFQQMLPQDIQSISGVMQLWDKKEFFSKLPVGVGIVRLAERYHRPFLVKFPLVTFKTNQISDEMICDNTRSLIKKFFISKLVFACHKDNIDQKLKINQIEEIEPIEIRDEDIEDESKLGNVHEKDFNFVTKPTNNTMNNVQQLDAINPRFMKTRDMNAKKIEKDRLSDVAFEREFNQKKKGEFEKQFKWKNSNNNINMNEKTLNQSIIRDQEMSQIVVKNAKPTENYLNSDQNVTDIASQSGMSKQLFERNEKLLSGLFKSNKVNKAISGLANQKIKQFQNHAQVNNKQQELLNILHQNGSLPTGKLYKLLNLSVRKCQAIRDELIEMGKIRVVDVRDTKGWRKIVSLADQQV